MSKLNLIVDATGKRDALERLLMSIKRQTVSGIIVTLVAAEEETVAHLKEKYAFDVTVTKHGFADGINMTIQKLSSPFFMPVASNQLFAVDFYENALPYLDECDGVMFNIAKKRANGKFAKIYKGSGAAVSEMLMRRPCINCCVFKTTVVKDNDIKLKSVTIANQAAFLEKYFECCETAEYVPDTRIYIDNISKSAKPSLIGAVGKKNSAAIIKESVLDTAYPFLGTEAYRKLCRAKSFFVRGVKHVLKR
ncbi:MAG: hypothetical protein II306_03500 [Clostridia bacterium]|nr:hypothetical protein [Clostridia bacterium]